jgi:hypothetical protein
MVKTGSYPPKTFQFCRCLLDVPQQEPIGVSGLTDVLMVRADIRVDRGRPLEGRGIAASTVADGFRPDLLDLLEHPFDGAAWLPDTLHDFVDGFSRQSQLGDLEPLGAQQAHEPLDLVFRDDRHLRRGKIALEEIQVVRHVKPGEAEVQARRSLAPRAALFRVRLAQPG